MTPLATHQFDSDNLESSLRRHGALPSDYREIEDLSGRVPHVGYGDARKSQYTSPKTGRQVYVLEQSGMYAADAWVTRTWQFSTDFTAAEAAEFLATEAAKRQEVSHA